MARPVYHTQTILASYIGVHSGSLKIIKICLEQSQKPEIIIFAFQM